MKAKRNIEWNFENNFAAEVDECTMIVVAEIDSRESLAEILCMCELHRQYERAGFVNIAPLAWIRDQADIGDSRLSDVNGRQTFRKIANDVELRFDNEAPGGIDEEFFLAGSYQGETFMKLVRAVELK